MVAAIALFGIAWMTATFIDANEALIVDTVGGWIDDYKFVFAISVFVVAALTTSQSTATRTMVPIGLAAGLAPGLLTGMWGGAVGGVYSLPSGGPQIAGANFDLSGTTKLGTKLVRPQLLRPDADPHRRPRCSSAPSSAPSSSSAPIPDPGVHAPVALLDECGDDSAEEQTSAEAGGDIERVVGADVHAADHHQHDCEDRRPGPRQGQDRCDGRRDCGGQDDMARREAAPGFGHVASTSNRTHLAGSRPLANGEVGRHLSTNDPLGDELEHHRQDHADGDGEITAHEGHDQSSGCANREIADLHRRPEWPIQPIGQAVDRVEDQGLLITDRRLPGVRDG